MGKARETDLAAVALLRCFWAGVYVPDKRRSWTKIFSCYRRGTQRFIKGHRSALDVNVWHLWHSVKSNGPYSGCRKVCLTSWLHEDVFCTRFRLKIFHLLLSLLWKTPSFSMLVLFLTSAELVLSKEATCSWGLIRFNLKMCNVLSADCFLSETKKTTNLRTQSHTWLLKFSLSASISSFALTEEDHCFSLRDFKILQQSSSYYIQLSVSMCMFPIYKYITFQQEWFHSLGATFSSLLSTFHCKTSSQKSGQ